MILVGYVAAILTIGMVLVSRFGWIGR
jgi:hypothetical protein